jgi:hypothetical protein
VHTLPAKANLPGAPVLETYTKCTDSMAIAYYKLTLLRKHTVHALPYSGCLTKQGRYGEAGVPAAARESCTMTTCLSGAVLHSPAPK